jgi:hypothetical protein
VVAVAAFDTLTGSSRAFIDQRERPLLEKKICAEEFFSTNKKTAAETFLSAP